MAMGRGNGIFGLILWLYFGCTEAQRLLQCRDSLPQSQCNAFRNDNSCTRRNNREFLSPLCGVTCGYCLATNPCQPNPCNNQGRCLDGDQGSFYCSCTANYDGPLCQTQLQVDYCSPNPCRNRGTCLVGIGTFACSCPSPYTGRTCESITADPCSPNPCNNDGTCLRSVLRHYCICTNRYTGENCDSAISTPCDPNPCRNNGVCLGSSAQRSSFACLCQSPMTGATCEQRLTACDLNPCQNNGLCVVNRFSYLCDCQYPYYGDNCQYTDKCTENPCGPGVCTRAGMNYTCSCPTGYTGINCETRVTPCDPLNPCQNEGVCVVSGTSYFCNCQYPYTGDNCEARNPCTTNPCGPGSCFSSGSNHSCICPSSHTGRNCELRVTPCEPSPCRGRGSCYIYGSTYFCSCQYPYTGVNCESAEPCSSSPCQNRGTCINDASNSNYTCDCLSPYTGRNCQTRAFNPCSAQPCGNQGVCRQSGSTYTCTCFPPFAGRNCESQDLNPCSSRPCRNQGTCGSTSRSTYTCRCIPPYTGRDCEFQDFNPCGSQPCNNQGTCRQSGPNYICTCIPPYTGRNCESQEFNLCSSQPCRNQGVCRQSGSTYTCFCSPPYSGRNCQSLENNPCSSQPCSNQGVCSQSGSTYTCFCSPPYSGRNCEYLENDPCSTQPCINRGICSQSGSTYTCFCSAPYTGRNCESQENNPCSSQPCNNQGICRQSGSTYTCTCIPPYSGNNCDIQTFEFNPCSSGPCRNQGSCTSSGSTYTCNCPSSFTGTNCEAEDSEEHCGIAKPTAYIVGGSTSKPNAWPWMVSLQDKRGRHLCGANIVSRQLIVTAGHCTLSNYFTGTVHSPSSLQVVVGAHNLAAQDGVIYSVQEIITHPYFFYNPTTDVPLYDIAIIRLSNALTFSKTISPICLPPENRNMSDYTTCFVTGWGYVFGGNSTVPLLRQTRSPLVSDRECRQRLPYTYRNRLRDYIMTCAGDANSGTCNGDSGGPLACTTAASFSGKYELSGLTSWGPLACDSVSVYTEVPPFVNWINRYMVTCLPNPCNAGSCTTSGNVIICTCPAGISGKYCEQDSQAGGGTVWECSFEDTEASRDGRTWCNLEQSTQDVINWRNIQGRTPSVLTGPLQAYNGRNYAYLEASDQDEGDSSSFLLPILRWRGVYCLQFAYHLYGTHIGSLEINLITSNQVKQRQWQCQGPRGETWFSTKVQLSIQNGDKIEIIGIRGNGYRGDIAIDDFSLTRDSCRGATNSC